MPTVPATALTTIRERVAKVNRRAEKLGVEGVSLSVGEPFTRKETDERGFEVVYELVEVEVTGPVVKFDGWVFLATIDHAEGLVRTSPQHEVEGVAHYADEPACEHCGHDRQRNTTYILGREDDLDSRIQVGSTCIKDFLGHTVSLYTFDAAAELADDLEGWGFSGPAHWGLKSFLAATIDVIHHNGWTPRSKAGYGADATADLVVSYLSTPDVKVAERLVPEGAPDTEELVEKVIAWGETQDPANDYMHNVLRVIDNGFVSVKSAGIAASIVSAYRRSEERRITKERERANAEPVPVTDERIEVTGTIVKVDVKENDYGVRYVMTVLDDRGFRLWGTQGKGLHAAEGARVSFTAKVERSDRDEFFGFFNRPTKGRVIEPAPELVG